jgi:hypothetical protein
MTILRAAPLAAVLALGAHAAPAMAQSTDFDGTWNFVLTCSVNSVTRQAAFTDRFTAEVNQGAFTRSRTVRFGEGPAQVDRLEGSISNARMAVVVESQRGNQRWTTRLDGPAASPIAFELQGGTFLADGRQVRGCQMTASMVRPAPQSIAATALTRIAQVAEAMQALTARATAAEREVERLRAEAQQNEDRLQTELDFARFEGNALRTELDQRARQAVEAAQQIAALTARATQAEAAARTAAASATQAQQAAQAATTRATQAEAAATAARAEAMRQQQAAQQAAAQASQASDRAARAEAAAAALRTELEQARRRATEAEAAATAARGEATRQQQAAQQAAAQASQASDRAARAEAAAAALRTELEQARRALAEAQAQPPAAPRQ